MIEIREATAEDNDALNELQKKCPMGTSLVLGVDSSPDYFARSKPFENWRLLVAAENDTVIGSAACAISDTYVEDRRIRTAYEYGFAVDPLHRRKGTAEKLHRQIEHIALGRDVDLLHLDITQDNLPSINFFLKMGFEKVKDCAMISLMPYKRQKVTGEAHVRSMNKADVDEVAKLINETYGGYDFFAPFQPKSFLEYVDRIPHFSLKDINVLEDDGNIRACLGCWNYNKVRKYIVQRLNWKLKAQTLVIKLIGLFTEMPYIPKPGEPLLSYNLTTAAYKDAESFTELMKHVINAALDNKINFIHVPIDPSSQIATAFSQFRHVKMKLHIFAKSLKEKLPNLGQRKIYVDPIEM